MVKLTDIGRQIALAAGNAYRFATGGSAYDAVKGSKRRATPTGILRSEDDELTHTERRKLLSSARDVHRNFSLAAWMIRRHLDYVSTFSFQCKTDNGELDDSVERLVRWWSQPYNCDATGRMSLSKMVRLAEMRRVIDGDVFLLKLRDGTVQAIEGDRIRTPDGGVKPESGVNPQNLIHGVETDEAGRPLRYVVCKRSKSSDAGSFGKQFEFERVVQARNLYHFAYADRFDQVRGISPLAPAVNSLRDVYEGFDYALAKMKVSQLFGLIFYRDAADPVGEASAASDQDGDKYEVDFGTGPVKLELNAGDRAEFLESKTPSSEMQQFSQTMIAVALKALDIPYSFYAENFTNYSGARQALLQYELSAKIKREDVVAMLDHLTNWRIKMWIADGVLPEANYRWEWIPRGVSWIDPLKEINANIAAISSRITSRTRILREQGIDFYDLADELKAEESYFEKIGLPMAVDLQPAMFENAEDTQQAVQ